MYIGGEDSPKSPGSNGSELVERIRVMQRDYLAAQGIEAADAFSAPQPPSAPLLVSEGAGDEVQPSAQVYRTSPQDVPENLTLPRPVSPPADQVSSNPCQWDLTSLRKFGFTYLAGVFLFIITGPVSLITTV